MSSETVLYEYKDLELQALKHELDVEVNVNEFSLDVEFHDREDFVYERITGELYPRSFCLKTLNVPPRGGEFLRE